jgi:hypothetical protein
MAARLGIVAAFFALCTATSLDAHAGNQESVFLGNEAALSGGAVLPWVSDGGAPWYNPAGLATIERSSVDLSATAFVLRRYALPDAARTAIAGELVQEDGSFTEVVSVPAALTLMRKLSERWSGALSVFVPQQEDLLVKGAFARRSPNAGYEWAFAASRRVARYYAGPSVGVKLHERMHLGLSLFATYESRLTARDFFSTLDATGAPVQRAVITLDRKLQEKLFGTTAVLGWRWDVDDDWSVAIVVRSPLFHVDGSAELDLNTSAVTQPNGAPAQVEALRTNSDVEPRAFALMEPMRTQLGLSRRIGDARLTAQFEWQSATGRDDVVQRAIWNVRVGGVVPVSKRLELGGGLFTDRSPSTTPRDLGATKVNFYGGSVGGRYSTAHEVKDDEDEEKGLVFATTVAFRYALGLGEIGGLSFSPAAAPRLLVSDATVHELSLHIGSGVHF